MTKSTQAGSAGTILLIIVVALIIVGGIWYWNKNKVPATAPANNSAAAAVNSDSTESIETSLNSIDTSAQADVSAMNAAVKDN